MSQKSKRLRYRNVCFTAWNTVEYDTEHMKYLIVGEEVCPSTGKTHYQGYVEFLQQKDFSLIKRLLGEETHIESRRGSANQASAYCMKDNKFIEYGTMGKQGKRTDLDNVVEDIQSGLSLRETALAHPTQYIKYHKGIEKFRALQIEPRNWETEVIVLYGKTGCGKSRQARELCENYYVWTPARGKWFDNYDGQEDVIMEEFRGQLPLGFMLVLLDRYECPVECKGGTVEFCPKRIVITSPKHPKLWYEDDKNDKIQQLLRRITKIVDVSDVSEVSG